MSKRVVITGLGIVSPLGCDPREFFPRLCEGEIAVGPLDISAPADKLCYGYKVNDFDPRDILGKKGLRYLNRGTLFLASAAEMAVGYAGLSHAILADEAGVIMGSSFGNFPQTTDYTQKIYLQGPGNLTPMESYDVALNSSVNYLSVRFNLKGISRTISSGFTSALDAVTDAYRMIRRGDAELLLTGGVEQLTVDHYRILSLEYPFCDADEKDKDKSPRPYGKNRSGFLPGEGSVVFILEELGHARSRNANMLGEIIGWGSLFGGGTRSGICYDSMDMALRDSHLKAETIDWIMGSGNGLPDMDRLEAEAIDALFRINGVHVSSIKRFTGEGYGIGGGFSLAAGLMGIQNKRIPGTGTYEMGKDCPIRPICQTTDLPELSTVLLNSLDPQGNFSHLILSSIKL